MQKITRSFIDQLLNTVSILDYMESEYDSDFIGGKSGWANTNCPMPNHEDSSPSFGVNIDDNKYNCFGCGATGDIIKLVQQVEGLNFIEAIQRLSDFAGVDIEIANLDIKNLIRDLTNSLNDYMNIEKSNFPGGLSECGFLIAFADRVKKFEKQVEYDPHHLAWTETVYQNLEKLISENKYKEINKLWKNFSSEAKERINGR